MKYQLNLKLTSLGLFLLMTSTTLLAQSTTSTTKPKRTYAQKSPIEASTTVASQKTTRTYAPKNAVETSSPTSSQKPTRTYAKKPDDRNANPISEVKKQSIPEKPKKTNTNETVTTTAEKKPKTSFWSSLFGGKSKTSNGNHTSQKTNETYKGHAVYVGPKGGKYYINKNGNKTYIK
jgi:colicin import membrane protein